MSWSIYNLAGCHRPLMNGSLCGRTHFVYRICVCSFVCLCAVGVDVIFQLLRVSSEGLGAQARQGRGCRVTWRAGVSSIWELETPLRVLAWAISLYYLGNSPERCPRVQIRLRSRAIWAGEGGCGSCQLAPDNTAPCCSARAAGTSQP